MTVAITDITNSLFYKWWIGGTVTSSDIVAAYQSVYAANLADSKYNLPDRSVHVLGGTDPDFATATGWAFNGTTQHFTTGIIPTGGNYTVIAMVDVPNTYTVSGTRYIFGETATNAVFSVRATLSPSGGNLAGTVTFLWAGSFRLYPVSYTPPSKMIVALAGNQPYVTDTNGNIEIPTAISSTFSGTPIAFYIAALNTAGSPGSYWSKTIQAIAFYNRVLTSTEVQNIANSMLGLSAQQTHLPNCNYIAIHPNTRRLAQRNHILLLALDGGVYVTEDGGITWKKFGLPDPSNAEFLDSPVATVDELTFNWVDYDPTNYDIIYVLGQKSSVNRQWIYKSTDKGINWISRGIVAT